jgi:uncharacterized membrane protein
MEPIQSTVEATEYSSAIPPATGSNKLNTGKSERIVSVLAGLALAFVAGKTLNSTSGKVLGLAGLMLLKRGVTGYCEVNNLIGRNTANKKSSAMEVKTVMTINKPRSEVYSFWRNFENLPRFMGHLREVEMLDERRSSWTAQLPGGVGHVSWEAVIEEEQENQLITWSSLPGSTIDNAGEVRFSDSRWEGQTEVCAKISYRLPGGDAGSVAGKLFNPFVEKMIRNDLKSFKSLLETGEIPTSGSPFSELKSKKSSDRIK